MNERPEAIPAGLERLIFFSDAVMAIALTLLVIDLRVPELDRSTATAELGRHLWGMSRHVGAFVFSFMMVAIYWDAHHRLFHAVRHLDRALVWLNFGFLFFIVLLPFPTALAANYPDVPVANVLYILTVASIGFLRTAMWVYASGRAHLVSPDFQKPDLVRLETLWSLSAPLCFLASLPVVLLSPAVGRAAWLSFLLIPIAAHLHAKRRRNRAAVA